MKKLLALLMALVMVLSLAACGSKKDDAPAATDEPTQETTPAEGTGEEAPAEGEGAGEEAPAEGEGAGEEAPAA